SGNSAPTLLEIEAAQPLFFQRHKNAVPVALCWVALHAHHRDRIAEIQKSVQVSVEVRGNNTLVVPIPNRITGAGVDCFGSNVARDTPLSQVHVLNPELG